MAELPEIFLLSNQMKSDLSGKKIINIVVRQPKCLNISSDAFINALTGALILDVTYHGKWIFVHTNQGWLLLCLGMGGEILLVDQNMVPEKYRVVLDFNDGICLSVNFWWFGYVHYVESLFEHTMTSKIGPNALDLDFKNLQSLLKGKRGTIKSFLLNQSNIGGIGNFYIHDILFLSRLNPLHSIPAMTEPQIAALAVAIRDRLQYSIDKGGSCYEVDLYGRKGGFTMSDLVIGYKENQPCPVCGTIIKKVKTGSTHSYICSSCQL